MIVTTPDQTISQLLNSYILHTATLPSPNSNGGSIHQEKIKHLHYLNDFRTQQCPLFLDHKCQSHRPFACFHWHFPNQRRRRPVKKSDGTFNYNPDVYCTSYDENTGICPNGDDCQYVHRNAGDTERRYHPRYYKTGQCIYETADNGTCVKNGQHCAFAHGIDDLRQPVYDIREIADAAEHIANLPATLEKERVLSEDPKWNDMLFVLAFYKTQLCKKPPRMCRQGYACPYYHNGKDRRRNPHTHRYRSTPCPQVKPGGDDWKDSSQCESQDECSYCHTRTEQQFHPEIYKSTKCNDMIHDGYCPRGPFCAFAHTETEASIGRDFLSSSPNLLDQLNKKHNQSLSSQTTFPEDCNNSASTSNSPSPTISCTNDDDHKTPSHLMYNASVSSNQLGIGMLGLSALNPGTIHYLQSLLTAQNQFINQYKSTGSPGKSMKQQITKTTAIGSNISSTCSSDDSGLSTARDDHILHSNTTTTASSINSRLLHHNSASITSSSSPSSSLPHQQQHHSSFLRRNINGTTTPNAGMSASSGFSTDCSTLCNFNKYFNTNTNNADSPEPIQDDDEQARYPNINLILGQVLGDSFNCSSLSEVNSLPDRCDLITETNNYLSYNESPATGTKLSSYRSGWETETINKPFICQSESLLETDEDQLHRNQLQSHDVVIDDVDDTIGATNRMDHAPLPTEDDDEEEEESEDVCPEMMVSAAAISAPMTIPGSSNSGSNNNIKRWNSSSLGNGSNEFSPISNSNQSSFTNRFMMDQSCRSNSACSPATTSQQHLPQSPIMIQSPFNNAACDLEKLVMEKELADVRGKLNDTQRELCSMRQQRDVVLMQLQESWKLIQTLVGPDTNSPNTTSSLISESNKENCQHPHHLGSNNNTPATNDK